jgi:tellurite resistance protein
LLKATITACRLFSNSKRSSSSVPKSIRRPHWSFGWSRVRVFASPQSSRRTATPKAEVRNLDKKLAETRGKLQDYLEDLYEDKEAEIEFLLR